MDMKTLIDKLIENIIEMNHERDLGIKEIDDYNELHDYLCGVYINGERIESNDKLYHEMLQILPKISLVEINEKLQEELDYYDPWKEHCDADFYGV